MLEVESLRFTYRRGGAELFGGLSHTFDEGMMTVVAGPSGQGKSTLLYILGLMLTPSAGVIRVGSTAASALPDSARAALRAKHIGFVFQDAALDPSRRILDSVVEPALYAGGRRQDVEARARRLLELFDVRGRAEHRPGQISGGQAQRVAVCRALINDPEIVLADEPTGNLDRTNAGIVLDALCRSAVQDRRTVVIASHDPFVLERAEQVLDLEAVAVA